MPVLTSSSPQLRKRRKKNDYYHSFVSGAGRFGSMTNRLFIDVVVASTANLTSLACAIVSVLHMQIHETNNNMSVVIFISAKRKPVIEPVEK